MVKHTLQQTKNECGIACLKMFYDLFEVPKSYNELINEVSVTNDGISIDEMLKSLNNLGLFKAYSIDIDNLKLMYPAIVLLKKKNKGHYVIVWKYDDGYFYVSDPNYNSIRKIKEKRFYKYFSTYIIFNQKRNVELPKKNKYKIYLGYFTIPYIILSILEVFLITYSMMYLFSIRDFTAFKVYYFLIILFINFIISIVKNICFNSIQKELDTRTIDLKIKEDFIRGKTNKINELRVSIQKGYYVKADIIRLLVNIIPSIFILIGTIIYLYIINTWLAILVFVIYLFVYIINYCFSKLKNTKLNLANQEEYRLNIYENNVLTKATKEVVLLQIQKIKEHTSKYNNYKQLNEIINFVLKQFSLMLVLIYMYMSKLDIYSVFVVTFYFYSFEGVVNISDFISKYFERKNLKINFLSE